ncbi:hypothetical protein ACFFQF_23865 [Haladaptatus pallidirubidus]|uniref:Uncharacterized protein n=1 Tax=Haladaptatus pallidirubidus TaxID=1008152 RepID=A0AAV3UNM5_9EURY|nr:hypothetical protein [Haladaptatus pallidirubidus]
MSIVNKEHLSSQSFVLELVVLILITCVAFVELWGSGLPQLPDAVILAVSTGGGFICAIIWAIIDDKGHFQEHISNYGCWSYNSTHDIS